MLALLYLGRFKLGTWSWAGFDTLLSDFRALQTKDMKVRYLW